MTTRKKARPAWLLIFAITTRRVQASGTTPPTPYVRWGRTPAEEICDVTPPTKGGRAVAILRPEMARLSVRARAFVRAVLVADGCADDDGAHASALENAAAN